MPRGNGTGPRSQGPMTGRGMGYCTGYSRPEFSNYRYPSGRDVQITRFSGGRGRGRGRGSRFRPSGRRRANF